MNTRFKVRLRKSSGQSLIEILLMISLVVVLVTSIVVGSTVSLRNQQISGSKDQALRYAQQGVEIVRALRNADWTSFQLYSGSWCMDKDGVLTAFVGACSPFLDEKYQRVAKFTWDSVSERMNVQVLMSWDIGSKAYSTMLEIYFTDWK
ncbi:MAG: hypothetical protein AAB492_00235 [Patescibacteria group bacterium]